jgi:hypothetical protein
MKLKRKVTVHEDGVDREGFLFIDGPYRAGDLWACRWKCDHIHPAEKIVYGSDEISALYYCLNFIGSFFHNMQEFGVTVTYLDSGDTGGFDFGKGRITQSER